jgi:hypothetical protein
MATSFEKRILKRAKESSDNWVRQVALPDSLEFRNASMVVKSAFCLDSGSVSIFCIRCFSDGLSFSRSAE